MAENDDEREAEPAGMSWLVIAFMATCLFLTGAMAYYAWDVFERSV